MRYWILRPGILLELRSTKRPRGWKRKGTNILGTLTHGKSGKINDTTLHELDDEIESVKKEIEELKNRNKDKL
jgi:hypothetical protein